MKTVLPVVHMNGSGLEDLIEDRLSVVNALRAAIDALNGAGPHMRDYYPVEGLYQLAKDQHGRRHDALRLLMEEIEAEVYALDAQRKR